VRDAARAHVVHDPAVAPPGEAPVELGIHQGRVVVRHVFPEDVGVHVSVIQDRAHHGDDEVRDAVHHLLDEDRIVVEERAQPLHATMPLSPPKNPPQRSEMTTSGKSRSRYAPSVRA